MNPEVFIEVTPGEEIFPTLSTRKFLDAIVSFDMLDQFLLH